MEINLDTNMHPIMHSKIVYVLKVKRIKYLIKYILLKVIRKINLILSIHISKKSLSTSRYLPIQV